MNSRHVLIFRVTLGLLILVAAFCAVRLFMDINQLGMQKVVDGLARTRLGNVAALIAVLSVFRIGMAPALRSTPIHLRSSEYRAGKIANEFLDALIYAGGFVFLIIRPFIVQAFLIPSGSMWPTLDINDFIVANKAIYRYTEPKDNDIVVFRPPNRAAHPDQLDAQGNITVDFVKRLIGTPGEVIELRKGVLYRNGQPDQLDLGHAHYSVEDARSAGGEPTGYHQMPPDQVQALPKANFKFVEYRGQVIPLDYSDFDANASNPALGAYEQVAKDYRIDDPAVQRQLMAQPPQPIPKGMFFFMGDNRNGSDDGRFWGLVPRDSIIGRSEFIWMPLSHMGRTR